jgi:hypothetical protein
MPPIWMLGVDQHCDPIQDVGSIDPDTVNETALEHCGWIEKTAAVIEQVRHPATTQSTNWG